MSKSAPKPFAAAAPKPTAVSSAAAFPPMSSAAPKSPFASSEDKKDSDSIDYKQVLTKFYNENNPAKVAEVDASLVKYKVS